MSFKNGSILLVSINSFLDSFRVLMLSIPGFNGVRLVPKELTMQESPE
jgi:hypothetical protein